MKKNQRQNNSLKNQFPSTKNCLYFDPFKRGPLGKKAFSIANRALFRVYNEGTRCLDWLLPYYGLARRELARFLKAPNGSKECAFFQNTTTAITTVAQGLNWDPGDEIIITDQEYPGNIGPWLNLQHKGIIIKTLLSEIDGSVSLDKLETLISPKTRLIATSSVYYKTGFRLDLERLVSICKPRNILILLDAAQSLGVFPLDVSELNIDFVVGDMRKFLCSLDGAGFLWGKLELIKQLQPIILGAVSFEFLNPFTLDYSIKQDGRKFNAGAFSSISIAAACEMLRFWNTVDLEKTSQTIQSQICKLEKDLNLKLYSRRNRSSICHIPISRHKMKKLSQKIKVRAEFGKTGIRIAPHIYTSNNEIDELINLVI